MKTDIDVVLDGCGVVFVHDVGLASALIYSGEELLSIDKLSDGSMSDLVFGDTSESDRVGYLYGEGNLQVDAKKFYETIEALRQRIDESR